MCTWQVISAAVKYHQWFSLHSWTILCTYAIVFAQLSDWYLCTCTTISHQGSKFLIFLLTRLLARGDLANIEKLLVIFCYLFPTCIHWEVKQNVPLVVFWCAEVLFIMATNFVQSHWSKLILDGQFVHRYMGSVRWVIKNL